MINASSRRKEGAPVWAVLGAPLVGIPLLVAILALSSAGVDGLPGDTGPSVEEVRVERAEMLARGETASADGDPDVVDHHHPEEGLPDGHAVDAREG